MGWSCSHTLMNTPQDRRLFTPSPSAQRDLESGNKGGAVPSQTAGCRHVRGKAREATYKKRRVFPLVF